MTPLHFDHFNHQGAWSTLSQRLTGNAIAVAIEVGVAFPQQLLSPGVAADLLAPVMVSD